jgi:predicted ATPase/DNA-binding winged helix-turn-helix (wHTH) protein
MLERDGVSVPIGGRAFDILLVLAERPGEVVSNRDLVTQVWSDINVGEGSLRYHIAALRKALGDGEGDVRYIANVPGRGYSLVAPVSRLSEPEAEPLSPIETSGPGDVANDAAPKLSSARHSTNIPIATSPLIGRAATLLEVRNLLSTRRSVTLTGPGGIGKTTLALELARSSSQDFPDGRFLVELASLSNVSGVASAVASVMGIEVGSQEITAQSVAQAIDNKELLLVIDNCEHVLDGAAAVVETILSRCERVKVLATSREVLRVAGEHVYRVVPLDVPPEYGTTTTDILDHSAIKLFMARAKSVGSDLEPDEENLRAVASICRRLDGIPLAIELAAARTAMLRPAEIATLLDDRFNLLTVGRRTALPRHQTLRAALDWSYELLTEVEARLLRHLAVFKGDFSLAAAAVVADLSTIATADYLAGLVVKSLVVADLLSETSQYRLLETNRAYALEKLLDKGEHREAARRHAEYHLNLLMQAEQENATVRPGRMTNYVRVIDNIRAGLDWAFGAEGDLHTGVTLAAAAVPLWMQLSLFRECRERSEIALANLDLWVGAGDFARLRMQLLAAIGWSLIYSVGRSPEAGTALGKALDLADQLNDNEYRLRALWGLCIDQFNNGEFAHALGFARRFAETATDSADPVNLIMGDRLLAVAFHYLGDQRKARFHIDRAHAHLSDLGDQPKIFPLDLQTSTHYFRARVLWLQGLADQSVRLVAQNVEEGRRHALTFCSVLGQGACPIYYFAGDLDAAARYGEALLEHCERHAIRLWQLWANCFKGMVIAKRGNVEAGLQLLRHALESAGDARFLPRFLVPLGEFAAFLGEAGEVDQGLTAVEQTLQRCKVRDEQWYVPELLRIKGELILKAAAAEAASDAERCFHNGLELAREQGALFWELRNALSLARLRMGQDRQSDARELLRPAFGQFTEGHWIADLSEASGLLDSS